MKNITEFPVEVITEFLTDQHYDFIDQSNNQIHACRYGIIDHPIWGETEAVVYCKTWNSIEEFEEYLFSWWSFYCEAEDAVGNYLGSLGLI